MAVCGNLETKVGVNLAVSGMEIGLGNVWHFCYMTAQDGSTADLVFSVKTLFGCCEGLIFNAFLTLDAFLVCILVGRMVSGKTVKTELASWRTIFLAFCRIWLSPVCPVFPFGIAVVFLYG